eukprot:SAG31_NODE_8956_length_1357_cov_1.727345_2_plen_145_part_01
MLAVAALLGIAAQGITAADTASHAERPWLDRSLPVAARVDQLLPKMTRFGCCSTCVLPPKLRAHLNSVRAFTSLCRPREEKIAMTFATHTDQCAHFCRRHSEHHTFFTEDFLSAGQSSNGSTRQVSVLPNSCQHSSVLRRRSKIA